MVSAQITGMNANTYFSGNTANSKSKTGSTAMDFGTMMSQNVNSNAHTGLVGKQDFSKIKTNVKSSENEAKPQQTQTGDETSSGVEKQASDKTEVKNTVTEAEEKIADKVKEKLDLSDEELESLLALLGMTVADLADTDNLTRFVAAAMENGQENTFSLITNEEFLDNVNTLADFIDSQVNSVDTKTEAQPQQTKQLFKAENLETVARDSEKIAGQGDEAVNKPELADKIEIVNLKTDKPGNTSTDFSESNNRSLSENSQGRKTDVVTIATEITQSVGEVFAEVIGDETVTVDGADVVRQIIDAVKVTSGNDFSSLEIALNPEHLGKVNLTVVAKNGSVTAQLVAENETVKRAIESQLTVLKNNLEQQGIKVDAVEVTVASHSFENNAGLARGNQENQQNGQSRRKNLNLDSLDELNDEELSPQELRIRRLLDDNSSVEFKA
ncbi:MAG: flagellar hook-length control protein FliK [Lachnospiraceae bacterium]